MENSEESKRTKQFERLYTAVLLLLVAVLLLVSIFYTTGLWWVKVSISLVLVVISAFFGRKYLRNR